MREFDMRHLQLRALAAQHCKVLAPVQLEGFAGAEGQRNKGPAPGGLLLALTICPPPPRKGGYPAIRAGEAKCHKIGMQLLQ